jgi:hypothetical protein
MNTVGREETLARGRGHEEVSRPATNILSVKQRYYHFYFFHDRQITLLPVDVDATDTQKFLYVPEIQTEKYHKLSFKLSLPIKSVFLV